MQALGRVDRKVRHGFFAAYPFVEHAQHVLRVAAQLYGAVHLAAGVKNSALLFVVQHRGGARAIAPLFVIKGGPIGAALWRADGLALVLFVRHQDAEHAHWTGHGGYLELVGLALHCVHYVGRMDGAAKLGERRVKRRRLFAIGLENFLALFEVDEEAELVGVLGGA